jgi:hypothetical protein
MDMMAMVSGILAMQAGNTQMQVATDIMKSNMDAAKSTVQTLLGSAQQTSLANVGAGIGSNVNISA